jgi:hypothetical protein
LGPRDRLIRATSSRRGRVGGRKLDFTRYCQFARWRRVGAALQGFDLATRDRGGARGSGRHRADTIPHDRIDDVDSRRRRREHACRLYVGPWPSLPAGGAIDREPATSSRCHVSTTLRANNTASLIEICQTGPSLRRPTDSTGRRHYAGSYNCRAGTSWISACTRCSVA